MNKVKKKKRAPMKLFIWTDFCPDYSGGLAFAVAKDELEARKMIENKYREENNCFEIKQWGDLQIKPLNRKIALFVSGGA
jgi:hypothetical protein